MNTEGGGVGQPNPPAPVDYPMSSEELAGPTPYAYAPTIRTVLKPGVIPLRPLTLGDIFNGAVNYIRANPKTTLGITTVVVILGELLTLIANVVPAATFANPMLSSDDVSPEALFAGLASNVAGLLGTLVTSILLSGMLTVIVGRAVFGSTITIPEAWSKLRGRLLALIGLAFLQLIAAAVVIGIPALVVVAVAVAVAPAVGILLAIPLGLLILIAVIYLYTMVSFAGPLVVLERLSVFKAISRSFALVRNGFWRVLGITWLAQLVAWAATFAITRPFTIIGEIMSVDGDSLSLIMTGFALVSVGNALGQIIVAPFLAGVVVLLYTDRRIRWEAFDLVLHGGAAAAATDDLHTADYLWLVRQP